MRVAEFLILYLGIPTFYYLQWLRVPLLPLLFMMTIWCLIVLACDKSFDRGQLWNPGALKPQLRRILFIFPIGAISISIGVILFEPESLFSFVRWAPFWWVMVMIFYPVLSAYPQEIVYRAFFYHRYCDIFPHRGLRILVSALVFGYMHIVLRNELAVVLTSIGGALFAFTYDRTRSTFAAAFEHALYGCFLFTIGLGFYFYHGAVR